MDLLLMGLGLGLAAGVSPGPLLTLVVASTLSRGFGAGLRVALAPILTDAPIILLALLVLRDLPTSWLNLIGALGGCVIVYLGVGTLRDPSYGEEPGTDGGDARDLLRGALVNLLNPHPWVFWITVQGPLVLQGWRRSPWTAALFVTAFYTAIVGSKVAIAWLVARGRRSLAGRWSQRLLIACGLLLIGMGLYLLVRSIAAWVGGGT